MDCSLPGSSVYGILQERILEWVTSPFSSRSSQPRDEISLSSILYIGRLVFFTTRAKGILKKIKRVCIFCTSMWEWECICFSAEFYWRLCSLMILWLILWLIYRIRWIKKQILVTNRKKIWTDASCSLNDFSHWLILFNSGENWKSMASLQLIGTAGLCRNLFLKFNIIVTLFFQPCRLLGRLKMTKLFIET